jgi:hypothetical protein
VSAGGTGTALGGVSSNPPNNTPNNPTLFDSTQSPATFCPTPSGTCGPTVGGATTAPAATTATGTPSSPTVASNASTTAPATSTSTCGITNLSGCFSGDNFIAGALGFLLIAAGVFLFKPAREAIVSAAVAA